MVLGPPVRPEPPPAETLPRLSVVIPTYQRRDLVLASVRALAGQETEAPFEVIVVVDGSTDGTAEAIHAEHWPFPLTVVEQENQGLAAARNRGAREARAEVILFLDDDMEADPRLVRVHLEAHSHGAEAVVGAMPLHPASPRNLLARETGRWADELAARCAQPGYELTADDIFGGHLSLRRELFDQLGGFDERFTRGGAFGNEDVDLAHRLVAGEHRIVFRSDAVARQRFVVTAGEHLRRWRDVGAADVKLARQRRQLHPGHRAAGVRGTPSGRLVRLAVSVPSVVDVLIAPLRALGIALVDRGASDPLTRRLFTLLHWTHYWLGVARAGGPLDGEGVRVLCWHALSDLGDDDVLRDYGVPPELLAEQIETLSQAGWTPVTVDELLRLLDTGEEVARRSVLVTFDDVYEDLPDRGLPVLRRMDVPAAAFVVTGHVGGHNAWDEHLRVTHLPLADWPALHVLQEAGIELGAHSRTHPSLPQLDDDRLGSEVAGSRRDLAAGGLRRPRLFAYPHGEWDARVRDAVESTGYQAAFTVDPGVAGPGGSPHAVPRIEITPEDRGWRLRLKVRLGGRYPFAWSPARERWKLLVVRLRRLLRPLRPVRDLVRGAWNRRGGTIDGA